MSDSEKRDENQIESDQAVFEALADAQQQYEQYLTISESVPSLYAWIEVAVPPSPDLPLSLQLSRD